MTDMLRIYFTRLKILLRSTGNLFWTFLFPICLGTFFYLGFGKLSNDTILSTMKVYLDKEITDTMFVNTMKEVEIKEDVPLFSVNQEYSKTELETLLGEGKITGYIYFEEEVIFYRIKESGLDQTIVKSFLDQFIQTKNLVLKVSAWDLSKLPTILEDLNRHVDYTEAVNTMANPKANMFLIYFYSLIAMACMYACYWGLGLINDIQANLSDLAARVSVTPTHKFKVILTYFLAALTLHFAGSIGLISYLRFVLGVEFSDDMLLIILSALVGSIGGIALGCFLSAFIRGSFAKKEGVSTVVTLALSFLSGLMFVNVKYMVDTNVPLLGYINPANLLTNTFYSLYYYSDIGRYFQNLGLLGAVSVILLVLTYFRLRGSKYDSI